jgi:hypothetical protein
MPFTTVTNPPGTPQPEDRDSSETDLPERRKRARLQLRWSVCFFLEDRREPIQATTLNVSSDGFYCLANVAFDPGQVLGCLLLVPANDPDGPERKVALDCRVRVVRVNDREIDRMYGIACKIEDYRFIQL